MSPELFLKSILIYHDDWVKQKKRVLRWLQEEFSSEERIIVRSSSASEDDLYYTRAGSFLSVPDVSLSDFKEIRAAIDQVFESYGNIGSKDAVLIQPFIKFPKRVIVMRTAPIEHPLQDLITVVESPARSAVITAGEGATTSYFVCREHFESAILDWLEMSYAVALQAEKSISANGSLQEHLFDEDNKIKILQVRPLPASLKSKASRTVLKDRFFEIEKKASSHLAWSGPLSRLSDWNTSEILGSQPTPLARSMYRELLLDGTCARVRAEMGYCSLKDPRLSVEIGCHLYIDIGQSLLSLMPAGVSDDLIAEIQQQQLSLLNENADLHATMEFDLALSHCPLFLENWRSCQFIKNLPSQKQSELYTSLNCLMDRLMASSYKLKKLRTENICHLFQANESLFDSWTSSQNLAEIFVASSRLGFIGRSYLNEFGEVTHRHDLSVEIIESASKWARFILNDLQMLNRSRKKLMARELAYEIQSDAYELSVISESCEASLSLDPERLRKSFVFELKKATDYSEDYLSNIFNLSWEGICSRELIKRIYLSQLNVLLSDISLFLDGLGIDHEDKSFLSIKEILSLAKGDSLKSAKSSIDSRKIQYELDKAIQLPDLLTADTHLMCFKVVQKGPEYIWPQEIHCPLISLEEAKMDPSLVSKRAVIFERGEPGLDWLFDLRPLAVITRYGGPNSHLAIRCLESKVTGVLGLDRLSFLKGSMAKSVRISGNRKQIDFQFIS